MHTLGDIAKSLNRPAVYVHKLQARFELPVCKDSGYTNAYLEFLRTLLFLRILNISEENLRDLWHLEKKLLQLLHVHSTGSPTWFLDACGQTTHRQRRLLLSNFDLGVTLPSGTVQLGLDFSSKLPELFDGQEMGEDALRTLADYVAVHSRLQSKVTAEIPLLQQASRWSSRIISHKKYRPRSARSVCDF
jgi:hypothetical protein